MIAARQSLERRRAGGFTLTELLIVVFIASLSVSGLLLIYSRSTHGVEIQDSYLQLQRQLRFALESIKNDIRLAGFLATPNSHVDTNLCEPPEDGTGSVLYLRAVEIAENDGYVLLAASNTNITPMSIKIFGDFSGGTVYSTDGISGTSVTLFDDGNLPNASEEEFDRAFGTFNDAVHSDSPNRFLRIINKDGFDMLFPVTASVSANDQLTLASAPPIGAPPEICGIEGLASAHDVNLAYYVRYRVMQDPRGGTRPMLVREEMDIEGTTPKKGTRMMVAQNVVDVQFYDFIFDEDATGTNPTLAHYEFSTSTRGDGRTVAELLGSDELVAEPQNLRAVTVKITACEPNQDYDVQHTPRDSPGNNPLRTYKWDSSLAGAARCLSAASRVQIRSLAVRNMKQ